MKRRPPRSTLDRSSAASDVYKRQLQYSKASNYATQAHHNTGMADVEAYYVLEQDIEAVSYTHLRAHETALDLVCRLLLETIIAPTYI